jgi:hypothetical protein
MAKPTTLVNTTPTIAAPALAPTTAQTLQAQHLALATQLAVLLGLQHVRVPTSHRWLVATAVWHCAGNYTAAQQLANSWAAAYGVANPPAAQYGIMHSWLSRGPSMYVTGLAKPGRKPVAAPAAVALAAQAQDLNTASATA